MWVIKLILGQTNPILEATIKAATAHYAAAQGIAVLLWESRLDHSHDITALTGMKVLAIMQGAWSVIIRCKPDIRKGDWIAYYNGSTPKVA